MGNRDRADRILVELGHFDSRAAAQAAIAAGRVRVNGVPLAKPSARIGEGDRIEAFEDRDVFRRVALRHCR